MFSEDVRVRLVEIGKRAGWRDAEPGIVAAALVLLLAFAGWGMWRWWPRAAPQAAGATLAVRSGEASVVASLEPSTAVVHVVGRVRRPGVYTVAVDARVADAVEAAGGMLSSAVPSAVNLARRVTDGEQIVVPSKDEVARGDVPRLAGTARSSGGGGPVGGAVDVNTADAALLDTLPGVGPSTAAKILAERESGGPFKSVDDLGRVSGIGPKRLEQLRQYVVVR